MIRYPSEEKIGEPCTIYEIDVKLHRLRDVNLSDTQLHFETEEALLAFTFRIKNRYKWIGQVYLTGRSNGWLAIEDKKGGARLATLKTIDTLVTAACRKFQDNLRSVYGTTEPLTVGAMIKALRKVDPARLVYANLQEMPPLAVTRIIPEPGDAPGMILIDVAEEA